MTDKYLGTGGRIGYAVVDLPKQLRVHSTAHVEFWEVEERWHNLMHDPVGTK